MAQSALLNVMIAAVRKAARGLTRDFGEVENLQVSLKGPGDFVSVADKKAEKLLFDELSAARPDYGFLMEESGEIAGKDAQHRWIIDPLDGTTNFLHGNPLFALSVALERQGVLQAGVIYNPIMDELFTAERGRGAFCNDRRLRVAGRKKLQDCVLVTGIPHIGEAHQPFLTELKPMMAETAGIRRSGAAALDLAWTAAGRFDGYWERGPHAWDWAAGILMVQEAGGFVTDLTGGDKIYQTKSILAANEHIHTEMRKILTAGNSS